MTSVVILYLLAVIDGMFVGYRDAIGRNPRLDKHRYFLRAILTGIGLVHLALFAIAATVILTLAWVGDFAAATASFQEVAATMRVVYLGYAGCVALAFCGYALPSYDLRSYVTITALASLTLIRPPVIVVGAFVAALNADNPATWATCFVIAVTMASLQPGLNRLGWNRFDWSDYKLERGGLGSAPDVFEHVAVKAVDDSLRPQ